MNAVTPARYLHRRRTIGAAMTTQSMQPEFVFVIDNEATTRQQVEALLSADEVGARSFTSLVNFLNWLDYDRLPNTVVLAAEINLPELGGFDLLNILKADAVYLPTILMGTSMSVRDAVEAMHAGANYILQKPFTDSSFRAAVSRAVHAADSLQQPNKLAAPIKRKLSSLSQRQRELLIHVSKGCTNKEIARQLSISQKTVELHRAAMMQKMGVSSLAELMRIAIECGDLLHVGAQNECA